MPRIIPVLQLNNRKLVKTQHFIPKRYLGDPLNAIRIFNLKAANEVIILDIGATLNNAIDFNYLAKITAQAFIPLAYGGGVAKLDDVHRLYQIGFDRIILSTALHTNPELITSVAKVYGTQSVICSIDVRDGRTYSHGAKKIERNISIRQLLEKAIRLGAGEIFINNIGRDGTLSGLDQDLIKEVAAQSTVPVIFAGGANSIGDIKLGLQNGASAIAAGSLFSFYGRHRAVLINYYIDEE